MCTYIYTDLDTDKLGDVYLIINLFPIEKS